MSLKLNFSLFLLFLLSGIQQSCSDTSLTSGKSAEGSDRVRIADEGMTDSGDGSSESQNSDQADSTADDEKKKPHILNDNNIEATLFRKQTLFLYL